MDNQVATTASGVIIDVSANPGAFLTDVQAYDASDPILGTGNKPANVNFLDGLVSFRVSGFAGNSVTVDITYPSGGSEYWKVDDNGMWRKYLNVQFNVTIATLTLFDNDQLFDGDDRLGFILDPGGAGVPTMKTSRLRRRQVCR